MSDDRVREFIEKWALSELKERSAAQEHFIDLCNLLGHETPASADPTGKSFTFERAVAKADGKTGFADVWKKDFFAWEYKGKHKDLRAALDQLLKYQRNLGIPPLLVVCDFERYEIHTNFRGAVDKVYEFTNEQLAQETFLGYLRQLFFDPAKLHPDRNTDELTEDAAQRFGEVATQLERQGEDPQQAAHFLTQLVFAMFAEDIDLLPRARGSHSGIVTDILKEARGKTRAGAREDLAELFGAMSTGGRVMRMDIPHFNGGLFQAEDEVYVPPLDTGKVTERLIGAAELDWRSVNPSIFGTLFERGLDPEKRAQLGAHYTSRDDIVAIVEPVLMSPLRREWAALKAKAKKAKTAKTKLKHRDAMLERLRTVTVLDPACGSGNFLYVSLRLLLDLEQQVLTDELFAELDEAPKPGVSPLQLHGIEINPYAKELASIVVWIGYIQWHRRSGYEYDARPILQPFDNVWQMDAILGVAEDGSLYEPQWPEAEVIVGNPPFLGRNKLRSELGDDYTEALFALYESLPNGSDLCCYWFEQARQQVGGGKAQRVGLLATQGIRGGASRTVLERIKSSGNIFFAYSDRDWIQDGVAVHVSMVGFDDGSERVWLLDDEYVERINADLTGRIDLTVAEQLPENHKISFRGDGKTGPFEIESELAQEMLMAPLNPNGRNNRDVLHPWANGSDMTGRSRGMWIVDFGIAMPYEEATLYEMPFEHVRKNVKPMRESNRVRQSREHWWLHERPRPDMRDAITSLERYIVTPLVSKHRVFAWMDKEVLPDQQLIVIARDDYYFFGVLHNRIHEVWTLAQGSQLREKESGSRYTNTTTFETFPFPWAPGQEAQGDPRVEAIAEAARELNEKREAWLNPQMDASRGGVPVEAATLKKRTLTKLYNARPEWLDILHRKLDEAVMAAYGWEGELDDEEILGRLLALNLERAGVENQKSK